MIDNLKRSNEDRLEYYQIAEIQIETAIDLFFSKNYFCSITLAGAGEEILGKILSQCGEVHAQEDIVKTILEDDSSLTRKQIHDILNHAKNSLKHLPHMEFYGLIELKPVDDSLLMIIRAVTNYARLIGSVTPKMYNFSNSKDVRLMVDQILSRSDWEV